MNLAAFAKKPPRLHRDGTVSFFSYYQQEWVAKAIFVPAEELEAMTPRDRKRVKRHLRYDEVDH